MQSVFITILVIVLASLSDACKCLTNEINTADCDDEVDALLYSPLLLRTPHESHSINLSFNLNSPTRKVVQPHSQS